MNAEDGLGQPDVPHCAGRGRAVATGVVAGLRHMQHPAGPLHGMSLAGHHADGFEPPFGEVASPSGPRRVRPTRGWGHREPARCRSSAGGASLLGPPAVTSTSDWGLSEALRRPAAGLAELRGGAAQGAGRARRRRHRSAHGCSTTPLLRRARVFDEGGRGLLLVAQGPRVLVQSSPPEGVDDLGRTAPAGLTTAAGVVWLPEL